jgi:hypothetical protein
MMKVGLKIACSFFIGQSFLSMILNFIYETGCSYFFHSYGRRRTPRIIIGKELLFIEHYDRLSVKKTMNTSSEHIIETVIKSDFIPDFLVRQFPEEMFDL